VYAVTQFAPLFAAAMIECQPPRRAHQPGAEALPVAQLVEGAMGADEGFLRDIFRILLVAKHGERDSEGESRAAGHERLEFTLELVVHAHE
jgi:hypothetical protein